MARPRLPETESGEPAEFRSWIRGLRFSGFSIIMIGILALGVFIISPSMSIYLNQKQEIAALEASVQQKKQALDQANTEKDRWQDPAYVRSEARNRLFYMMPGENQLVVINDVGVPETQAAPASVGLQQTKVDWVKTMAFSLLSAGTTSAGSSALAPAPTEPAPAPAPVPGGEAPATTPEGTDNQ